MPTEIADSFRQLGRSGSVGTSSFFPIVESQDVNFAVEMVVTGNDCSGNIDTTPTGNGKKYIIGPNSCLTPSTTPAVGTWDIVMRTSGGWELYQDVSNNETNHGIVFDRRTQKFLQYSGDTTLGWVSVIRSGGIDGGTFS